MSGADQDEIITLIELAYDAGYSAGRQSGLRLAEFNLRLAETRQRASPKAETREGLRERSE